MQNTCLKVWKLKILVLHINLGACIRIAFLNKWVFDVIVSWIQLSQDFKVSNGGPFIKNFSVKINRYLFEMKA